MFANDNVRIGGKTTLEISTYRSHKDEEKILKRINANNIRLEKVKKEPEIECGNIKFKTAKNGDKYTDPLTGSKYDVMCVTDYETFLSLGYALWPNSESGACNFTTCQKLIDAIFNHKEIKITDADNAPGSRDVNI